MRFEFKYLATTLAFMAVGAAHADPLVINKGGATFQGTATLTLSADLLGDLDTGRMSVANFGGASIVNQKDSDGYYINVAVSAPMQTLTLDDNSLDHLGMSSKGGLTITAPVLRAVSTGGSLTVTDLATDLTTKTIYATLIGSNGVGTITHFALWNFATLTGPTKFTGDSYLDVNDIGGLSLTADGLAKWSQALGLLDIGLLGLKNTLDFGTLHTATSYTMPICCSPTPSVPEPSSPALMGLGLGLGLLGMAFAARRKAD